MPQQELYLLKIAAVLAAELMGWVGLRKCIRPLVEFVNPGQDGMRYALFLFNSSVLRDCLAHQARRASGSTVVPSQLFASRPGRKLR